MNKNFNLILALIGSISLMTLNNPIVINNFNSVFLFFNPTGTYNRISLIIQGTLSTIILIASCIGTLLTFIFSLIILNNLSLILTF